MFDLDDLLQQALNDLENGQPLESVLAGLPDDAAELVPLLRLAASVKALPQPEPSQTQVDAGQRRVMDAAREITRPAGHVRAQAPTVDNPAPAADQSIAWNSPWQRHRPAERAPSGRGGAWNRQRPTPRMWMGALAGVFLVILLFIGGLTWWLSRPAGAEAATLMDVTGQVEAASTDTSGDWRPVANGAEIRKGQRIRTAEGSGATLVFYEGTRSTIGESADLTIKALEGGSGKLLRVLIDQYAGRTANSVVPFRNANSSFIVNTPSGSATVHGTLFDVEIGQGGQTHFAVSSGKVLVYNDQSEVFVGAGQVTRTGLGEDIASPAYQFQVQGPVEQIDGSLWTVQGVSFTVNDQTNLSGDFAIGTPVSVAGHFDETGNRVADTVMTAANSETFATFSGQVISMDGDVWQIGANPVVVDTQTQRPDGLKAGETVRVTFKVVNGQWVAVKIERLSETPDEPTAQPSSTPNPDANPELVFDREEMETTGCGTDFSLNGTLTNTAAGPNDQAANVQLGYVISRGGEYVNGVELEPSGWATLQPGQSVPFRIHVTTAPDYRDTTGNQKQIKIRVFVASEANRPDLLESRMTATIVSNCKQDETGTPEQTRTPSQTPQVTPTLPGSATPDANTTCTGANPHPQGTRLAQRYGVPYEEIMSWFCQNFGFGEIDLAYTLSRQSGKPVEEIFAMRRSGLGWGQIKKQLAPAQPGNSGNNGNNGNDKKPDDKPGNGPKAKPTKKPK